MTRKTVLSRALSAVVALATAACTSSDLTDPGLENPIDLSLDFCLDDVPVWFAYQNSNGPVNVIVPNANGTFTFTATRRVVVAFVRQNVTDYKTEIIFTNNADLNQISGIPCIEEAGTKQVNGTVSGLTGADVGRVGMGTSSVLLTSAQTNFTLDNVVDSPLDLVASRIDVTGNEQHAINTIIRRALDPDPGSSLSLIDFSSAEGVAPVSQLASIINVEPDVAFLDNDFVSGLETSNKLTHVGGISASGNQTFVALPAATLATGDYHDLFVLAESGIVGARGARKVFRDPADKAFTLGPDLIDPIVTVIDTDPYVRTQVQLNGQLEYSTMVTMEFHQQTSFSSTDVTMSITASYLGGTPFLWNLPMPNFEGLSGWNDAWGLQTIDTDWTITAFFGPTRLVFGGRPVVGDSIKFASKSSSVSPLRISRIQEPHTVQRHFSRLR